MYGVYHHYSICVDYIVMTSLLLSLGNLKVDISAPYENMPCCLTSNLWEVSDWNSVLQSIAALSDYRPFTIVL